MRTYVGPGDRMRCAGRGAIAAFALVGSLLLAAMLAGPAAAQNDVGIQIDGGDRYARSADAIVTTNPPPQFTHVDLSNRDQWDVQRFTKPANERIRWSLVFGVPDRDGLKTVYARFTNERGRESRTFSDQIILDRARPRLLGGIRSRGNLREVNLHAEDRTSGVLAMQLAVGPGRISGWARFSPSFRMRTSSPPRFVRVADRAHNVSRWTRLRGSGLRQVVISPTASSSVRGTPNAWQFVGAFEPAKGARVIDAVRAYGRPDRFGENRFGGCDIRWLREGIRAMATSFGATGQTPCRADHGVQTLDFRGRAAFRFGWRTDKGLRIGDTLAKLRRLYPGAQRNRQGEWELVSVDTGIGSGPTPILRAVTTSGGRISELRTAIGGAGD